MPLVKASFALMLFASGLLAIPAPVAVAAASGQAAASSTARLLGTVTAINGNTVTLKPDTGAAVTVTVSDATRMVRTAPGQKDLTGATPIHVQDLAIGDRVLVRATPGAEENTYTAQAVIAMKQGDIAQKQQQERDDWQKRSIGGIVKSIDIANSSFVIVAGTRIFTIHATPATVVRRYAPDSVKFDDAKISSLNQIQPGDQLRARGDRSADGTEMTAEEIVAGSFRNIAATIVSVDAGTQTATVMDLAAKKPVVVRFTPDSQLHKLPPEMAQMIAARLKGGAAGGPPPQGDVHPAAGGENGGNGRQRGDLSQVLQRAPNVQLADLHKGDAVMIVATSGAANAATAITLLAGVEPMLQASTTASQSLFSSSWSLGGGGEAAAAAQQ